MPISLQVTGEQELQRAFDDWEKEVRDLRAPFTNLMLDVVNPMLRRKFATAGPGWKALSPAYQKWKAVRFPGKGILVRTGAMQTAFGGGVGMEFTVTAETLSINPSRTPYWKFHQKGTRRMPARPILDFGPSEQRQFGDYLTKWLSDRASQYGLRVR